VQDAGGAAGGFHTRNPPAKRALRPMCCDLSLTRRWQTTWFSGRFSRGFRACADRRMAPIFSLSRKASH